MSDLRLDDAYRCLRLGGEASLLDVERAYRALKETYASGGLATYALLEEDQRRAKLEEIERAYQKLQQHLGMPHHHEKETASAGAECEDAPMAEGLPPGEELRSWRERRGLSIHEVGVRTKISPMTLESIEKQNFSRLPAPVYLRGFLVQYLALLEAPRSEELVERYLSCYAEGQD